MNGVRLEALAEATALVLVRPILALATLEQLATALGRAEDRRLPVVIRSQHPRIFLAGADLHEIAKLGPGTARDYAAAGRRVLARIGSHPQPVVAEVNGACSGGGFDLAMACDRVVAGPGARFSHPGVRRGLVTGWGGTVTAPPQLGPGLSRRVLLTGDEVSAAEAVRVGWAVAGGDDPAAAAVAEAVRLARLHRSRIAAWRSLRAGNFVDRLQIAVVHNTGSRDVQPERESP